MTVYSLQGDPGEVVLEQCAMLIRKKENNICDSLA